MELNEVIPHCLEIKEKVLSSVTPEAHKGASLFKITPSTMSVTNRDSFADAKMQWQLDEEHPDDPSHVEQYEVIVKKFIASIATEDAQQDLKEFIQKAKKPRNIYRLKVLNSYMSWLPGGKEPLDNDHLKKALHNGMPQKWQERLLTAGVNYRTQTMPFLTRCFHNLEDLANKKEREHISMQRHERDRVRKHKLAGNQPGTRNSKKRERDNDKHSKSDTKKLAKTGATENDAQCPVHKNSNHTWWECFSSKYGKHKDAKPGQTGGKKPNNGRGNGKKNHTDNQYMCQEVDSDATTD